MRERRYIIHPSDASQEWRVAKLARDGLRLAAQEAKREGRAKEVVIRDYQPPRTDPQRKTLWLWCTEVASELTIRTGRRFRKEDVYEILLIDRFMPLHEAELVDPQTGEVKHRRKRTSEATRAEISEAMERFLAWAYEVEISLTVPEEGW